MTDCREMLLGAVADCLAERSDALVLFCVDRLMSRLNEDGVNGVFRECARYKNRLPKGRKADEKVRVVVHCRDGEAYGVNVPDNVELEVFNLD